jgi:hypothetical protein
MIRKVCAMESIRGSYKKCLTLQEWPFNFSLVRLVLDESYSAMWFFWHSSGNPIMTQNICSGE